MDIIAEYKEGKRDFSGANLEGANLKGAYLYGANLKGANLEGANLPDSSHAAISEILCQNADNMRKYMVAGLVAVRTEWCWEHFIPALREGGFADELRWALGVLKEWECFRKKASEYEEPEEVNPV